MFKIGQEEVEAIRLAIADGNLFRYSKQSRTEQLERGWAAKVGTAHCLALNSGTSALMCGLLGMGIGPGDEVIVPGYTFIATAAAVLAVGAIPILAEVDESLTLDAADFEAKITPHTKAVIPVHIQGMPANLGAILKVAGAHGIAVMEDACQADGGSYRGRCLGSLGDAGAHSFNFFKIIGAGEGGALVTSKRELLETATLAHDCGNAFFSEKAPTVPLFTGWNFRISEILSAVMLVQVDRLDGILSGLRREKTFLAGELRGRVEFVPSNDAEGDCGTTLALRFSTSESAARFTEAALAAGVGGVHSPIHTGKHVYTNWQAILEKKGAAHPAHNPYNFAKRPIAYSKEMLPRTLMHLARSVYVPMHVNHGEEKWEAMAKALKAAAEKASA
ncbi:MAG: DegT/DnrJ/EryC1/StrS family aminotransferase [Spirochaetes bacterium]|nr:DegT/DnrJ/EryC1/StrS family aminotransferase [Spirochaetota bacterium]